MSALLEVRHLVREFRQGGWLRAGEVHHTVDAVRFPVQQVSRELVRNALAELRLLNAALDPSPHFHGVP